jgi:hypothetical protein
MKKLFLAAPLAVTLALLMPFTAALYAAEIPETTPEMKEILLKYGSQAEKDSKAELEKLVQEEMLKKNLEAAREQQGDSPKVPSANEKKEAAAPSE